MLFLHADTTLPAGALAAAAAALDAGAPGGGFRSRFDDGRWIFRLAERLIDARTALTRVPLGDQAQFASRAVFEALGGFADWPMLEDLDFGRRLKRLGGVAILPLRVTTGARRYLAGGVLRTVARNWLIWTLFFAGVPPAGLARLYRRVR